MSEIDLRLTGGTVLLRLLNAGLKSHAPTVHGLYMTVVAQDGFPYENPPQRFSLTLPALKTIDVVVTPTAAGTYGVYDRTLHLTNGTTLPGGMLTHLEVTGP